MIKLKEMLSENVWDRSFGEPLPTLKSVIEKTNESCGCDTGNSCGCKSTIKESSTNRDYNDIALEYMEDEVLNRTKSWRKFSGMMEEKEPYKIIKKYTKMMAVMLKKCDMELKQYK